MRPRSISIALELALALTLAIAVSLAHSICISLNLLYSKCGPIIVLIVLRPVRLGAGLERLSACQSVRSIRLARTSFSEAIKSTHTVIEKRGRGKESISKSKANVANVDVAATAQRAQPKSQK